jgi:hypothetical protein
LRCKLVGNIAAGAWSVVNDHRGADVLAQFLGDDARACIGRAACRKADHHRDGFLGRKLLGLGAQRPAGAGQDKHGAQKVSFLHEDLQT